MEGALKCYMGQEKEHGRHFCSNICTSSRSLLV